MASKRTPYTARDLESNCEVGRLAPVFGPSDTHGRPARRRFKQPIGWVAFAILMLWRPYEILPIPSWTFQVIGLAGFAFLSNALLKFKRWGDEIKQLPKFGFWLSIAVIQLLVEKYFVWVVAALNERKYDDTFVPLQDNVALLAKAAARQNGALHAVIHWHWAHIGNFLFIFFALLVSVVWDQVPYSGFAMAARALAMHAIVRVYRILAFLFVIMPNARNPRCYAQRFKPPPEEWGAFFRMGVVAASGAGGCNDLLFSGHACTWMMPLMIFWTFYPHGPVRYILLAAFIQTSIRTAVEGWHYSVDFLLPGIVAAYVFRELKWLCPEDQAITERRKGAAADPTSKIALAAVLAGLAVFVVNAFFLGA